MLAITVFTPTYNRAETLHRARDSLLAQTLDPARFEWLIVDDGSTDGTRELVESWIGGPIAIRYTYQSNAGKHVAWNRALAQARGELFTCLDSDDACVPHALERFVSLWAARPKTQTKLAGILVRCQAPDGTPIGIPFPKVATADFAELYLLHGIQAETWMACQTAVLRENLFPEIRVPYLPEGVILHKISRDHKWLLNDECLRVYFTENAGRNDQISRMSSWHYAAGMALMHQSVLNNSWRFLSDMPVQFVRMSVHFSRFALHAGFRIDRQIASLEDPQARLLCWSTLPVALVVYAADRLRARDKPAIAH